MNDLSLANDIIYQFNKVSAVMKFQGETCHLNLPQRNPSFAVS